jgi:hypothetical protein
MFVARNPCPSGRESATSSATPMPSISVAHLDCRGHQKGAICPELTFHGLLSTGGLYTHDGTLPGRRETRRRRAHVGQSAVGREWAFERVRNWMEDPNASRLLWIVGAPGVGKSALAVRSRSSKRSSACSNSCKWSRMSAEKSGGARHFKSVESKPWESRLLFSSASLGPLPRIPPCRAAGFGRSTAGARKRLASPE